MALLKIIKLSNKTWKHNSDVDGNFILTKFYAKQEDNEFLLVETYGSKRRKYLISEIEVYDIGGSAELFTNFDDLFLRLEALKYPAFYIDGEVDLSTKVDKVSTAGVERAYIINADGSQGTKATSEFKDVLEFANLASFPTTGKTEKIYVALDTNFTYRWSGSAYVQIGGGALGFTPENVSNKATNLTSPDNTKYPTTLAVSTALQDKQNTLTNPITGTGTTNYVSKFTGTNTLGNSQIFDNGTNVGIGTTTPSEKLDVNGNIKTTSFIKSGGTSTQFLMADGSVDTYGTTAGTVAEGNHTHTFASITSKPTTLSGYGITDAEYKIPTNTIRTNLGNPTVREIALFHGEFTNKFRFVNATLQEESTDGVNWVTSTRATTNELKDIMIGEGQIGDITAIPSGTVGTYGGYRLTWDVTGIVGYVILNQLYIYSSTKGNNINITIEAYHNTDGWTVITGPHVFSIWPGHATIPHTSIPYDTTPVRYSKVRITFSSTHNSNTNQFNLLSIEWFGGYPAGRRNVESYDRDKNVTFPEKITSTGFIKSGGTSTQFLMADGSVSTLTNPITGTGTTNYIPKFSASGTIGNSIVYENGVNVGIGTTSPQAKLDVKAQGALATDIAFRVRNSTDTANFLVVNGAGDVYNNGAGGVSSNTFFGENVGRNATGGSNTAIGRNALQSNTTGGSNTAIGYGALYANTTGNYNTAIGYYALQSNTTGGSSNTAIGNSALEGNTTGYSNTAIGSSALYANTTGGYNTAIGVIALEGNTTGTANTAIGLSALNKNTTGGYNTAIGRNAGIFISDGSDNTITNNSIFIGDDTRALANNQTNQIVIGNSAIGLGSNSVVLGNTSITITQLRGQVIMGAFASAPTGIEGAIYYDSTTKKHYGFDGTNWNSLY